MTTDLRELLGDLTPDEIAQAVHDMSEADVVALLEATEKAPLLKPRDPLEQAQALDPLYRDRPHLRYLAERLRIAVEAVEGGESRYLVVSMPPRSGKSQLSSVYLPSWLISMHPEWPIGLISHDPSLAVNWGRDVRNLVEENAVALGVTLARDAGAAAEWKTTEKGGVLSRSVRQSITGRGFKCVGADSRILTDRGYITARDAYDNGITEILAYDHATERAVWRPVVAASRSRRADLVDVSTEGGRVLRCTSDHPIYSGGSYRPAGDLQVRDPLVATVDGAGVSVRPDVRAEQGHHPQEDQAGLRRGVVLHGVSQRQSAQAVLPGGSLLERVHVGMQEEPTSAEHASAVPASGLLPRVQRYLLAAHRVSGLLLSLLRGRRPLPLDDRLPQRGLERERDLLRDLVPQDQTFDPGARWSQVRGLPPVSGIQEGVHDADRAPHQRGEVGQPTRQPDHDVPVMPHPAPPVEGDAVSVVRPARGGSDWVYDFQVEDTHNFFAEGILVHNCLIVDDAVKDFADAHSASSRDWLWNWWTANAKTRQNGPWLVVFIGTRWHEDDILGRLLSDEYEGDPAQWESIKLPALAEDHDVLGRAPGEPLLSPLMDETEGEALARWAEIKSGVGSYTWNALYQQRPSPSKGAIFDVDWWRYWTTNPAHVSGTWSEDGLFTPDGRVVLLNPETDLRTARWLDSWDMAFKATDSSDYVVGQRWAQQGAQRYLVFQHRQRMTFTASREKMLAWGDPHSAAAPYSDKVYERLVEDKANGTAILDSLKEVISGLVPINPTESKEARARSVSPDVEAGNVLLPYPGDPGNEWVTDLLSELRDFPNGAHDDQVDGLTQALRRLRTPQKGSISQPSKITALHTRSRGQVALAHTRSYGDSPRRAR